MHLAFRSGFFCLFVFISVLLLSACDDDGPTAPDPTPTPNPTQTSTAVPTETPSPEPTETPTPVPENREFYGTSYRSDTGEAIGDIEYILYPDGFVSGRINRFWHCIGSGYTPEDKFFSTSFATQADSDGRFRYIYREGGSPHYYILHEIACTVGGNDAAGTWSSYTSWSTGECGGFGTWTANCRYGC